MLYNKYNFSIKCILLKLFKCHKSKSEKRNRKKQKKQMSWPTLSKSCPVMFYIMKYIMKLSCTAKNIKQR